MPKERRYSTSEVAQMWNVSESTIKRWADSDELHCYRTPGGHRKFRLEDIHEFQEERGFEATGLLSTEKWEDPELEVWLNQKRLDKIQDLGLYLASHNQSEKVGNLLERLYLRGMQLSELYDDMIIPICQQIDKRVQAKTLGKGLALLAQNNLEDALYLLFPRVMTRKKNDKTALCASRSRCCRTWINAVARVLEAEGWESLNLGHEVSYGVMGEVVREEPVNLVCLVCDRVQQDDAESGFEKLAEAAGRVRIPIVLAGESPQEVAQKLGLEVDECISTLRSLKGYLRVSH